MCGPQVVQRKWMYLEGIFIGSDDIKAQVQYTSRQSWPISISHSLSFSQEWKMHVAQPSIMFCPHCLTTRPFIRVAPHTAPRGRQGIRSRRSALQKDHDDDGQEHECRRRLPGREPVGRLKTALVLARQVPEIAVRHVGGQRWGQ